MKKFISFSLVAMLMLSLVGCGATGGKGNKGGDLTITNEILGEKHEFTYDKTPEKIVTLASPATEMLLALGLEDSVVGYACQDNEIPEKYKAGFDKLHSITDGWVVAKEAILALEPDFMMFWNGSADYTYDFLTSNNIGTYTMTSDVAGAKIESVYTDFENMGKIFGKEKRAEEIIKEMKAKIEPVESAVKDATPVSVAYVDAYSTDSAAFTAGDALVADIFRTAGAKNVIEANDTWLNVSWEEMAKADPECIVIGVYEGVEDAEHWKDFLKKHPAMSKTKAVQNENYIVVGLADLTVGERVADTVKVIAKHLHPDLVK